MTSAAATSELDPRRSLYLTASDYAAACGINPWKTPETLRLEKRNRMVPAQETDAMRLGKALEPAIVSWFEAQMGVQLERGPFICDEKNPGTLAATPDGLCRKQGVVLEAKLVVSENHADGDEFANWGDDWTDEVPIYYASQVHAQMAACEAIGIEVQEGYLCALRMRQQRFFIYRFEPDAGLYRDMRSFAADWFARHVVADEPCDGSDFDWRRLRRKPFSMAYVPEIAQFRADVALWARASEEATEAKKTAEQAKDRVLRVLGDCEGASLGPGFGAVYFREEGAGTDFGMGDKFVAHCPACGVGHRKKTRRVLRFKAKG